MKYILIILALALVSVSCTTYDTNANAAKQTLLENTCSEYKITDYYSNSPDIKAQCRCKGSGFVFESTIKCILGECQWAYGNKCDEYNEPEKLKDTVYISEIRHDTIYINKEAECDEDEYEKWLSEQIGVM
jgi:hypothetical protein